MSKNIIIPISILLMLLFTNCSMWKQSMITEGDINDAINNAITDFSHTSKLYKQDTVFDIEITSVDNMLVIGIIGTTNKLFVKSNNKIGTNSDPTFPTNFVIKNSRLFLWYDPNKTISQELRSVLIKYNHLDSVWMKEYDIPPYVIDDGKQGVIYYFCKKNLSIYKKTGSNTIKRHYKTPKLDCDLNK